jgi:glycosyltransferase involved in cell wall biosynthesis
MRIVFVSNTSFSMWNFRRHVIQALLNDGHQITCLVGADDTCQHLRDMGVNVIELSLSRSGMNPLHELRLIWILYRHLKLISSDIVISYTIKPNSYVPVLSRILGIPSLAVVTGLGYAFLQNTTKAFLGRIFLRSGLRNATYIWFLNRDDANVFINDNEKIEKKISILQGEGIDTEYFDDKKFSEQSKSQYVFLMISRLLKDKGVEDYAEAARLVRMKYPYSEFRIIGSFDTNNPSAISIKTMEDWKQAGNIKYLGQKDDVRYDIANADICVLPSYREGIPFALIEAASMRRPLIATDVPGCRDVVIPGKTGYIVPVKSPEKLADSMISMINLSKDEFFTMKEAARFDMIERFDKLIIIQFYRDFLKRLRGKE